MTKTADVYKVMYVTKHININLIGDIQAVLSDLLLMLKKHFLEKSVRLKTL